MLLAYETDTIAAISTPPGEGGIAIIRISGEDAFRIAERGFRGRGLLGEAASHTAHYGSFVDADGKSVDNVVAVVFRAPNSYTGENTVELSCHGGQLLTNRILESVIRFGARVAQPGEFTKKAFLNGRLDLAQAEAVADLIHARSERARQTSLAQLNGVLSAKIKDIRDELIATAGLLELELDFAEDGYEFTEKQKVAEQVRESITQIDELLLSYQAGKVYRDGVRVALAGAPNVGKSSLLNALLREDRAIVTHIAGTTRDIIEESITIGGLLFTITDTAGLRATDDPIEQEGVRRAEERLSSCDILLFLFDKANPPSEDGIRAAREVISRTESRGGSVVIVLNKIDLPDEWKDSVRVLMQLIPNQSALEVSAKTLSGVERLKETLVEIALGGKSATTESSVTITNARHFAALERARRSLLLCLDSLRGERSGEFVAVDLRAGLDSLGEIIGVVSTEDILNSIFSKFCIGK